MIIALIIAGGKGNRMGQDIPKQFLNVYDKPVIIYTLEAFQSHPLIDAIEVVCLDSWQGILDAYCKQFNITKLRGICAGGATGQASIKSGICAIASYADADDIVMVHDGTRPMVSSEIIAHNISVCQEYGNATAAIPCAEAMLVLSSGSAGQTGQTGLMMQTGHNKIYSPCGVETANHTDIALIAASQIDRAALCRTQTPQSMWLGGFISLHEEASKLGITGSVATCTLLVETGHKVYLSKGSEKNIKLTTVDDIDMFKALLHSKRSKWLK